MSEERRKIVIVLFQFSVVVKGMERRLSELGYEVETMTEGFDRIEKLADNTDLFLVYLPNDIMDDMVKQKVLSGVCEKIKEHSKSVIFMGEKKFHEDLSGALPIIDAYRWLDRPVDSEVLANEVKTAIAAGDNATEARKRILIVDDDPSYAGMVREWVKEFYHADIVTAGMQAITFLLKKPVDLVLLDYEMPVVNGPQVLQMLRQEPATANIPVVFLTGVGTKEEVARVMALKPDGYILKSTTRENLLGCLAKKLG